MKLVPQLANHDFFPPCPKGKEVNGELFPGRVPCASKSRPVFAPPTEPTCNSCRDSGDGRPQVVKTRQYKFLDRLEIWMGVFRWRVRGHWGRVKMN